GTDARLIKSIRKWDLVAVTINAVIGAGIFGLPSKVYSLAGAYSPAAFLLCAAFAAMIVLCFAEVASRFTETGGPYLYAREAFGPAAGFTIGWLMWIARTTAFAANTSIMLGYLSLFWPALMMRRTFVNLLFCASLIAQPPATPRKPVTVAYHGDDFAAAAKHL